MKYLINITICFFMLGTFAVMSNSCTPAKKVTSTNNNSQKKQANEKSLLWKVSGNGLKQPSYLFGTMHIIAKQDFFLPERVKKAFATADVAVFEIDMAEMQDPTNLIKLMNAMMMPDGLTLKTLLSENDYAKVKEELAKTPETSAMGSMVDRVKPLFISTMLAKGDMGDDVESYEMRFMEMVEQQKKKTAGLENIDFQISIFDSISYEDQAKMLVKQLELDASEQNKTLKEMVTLFKAEDVDGLQEMIARESNGISNFEATLLNSRNKNWVNMMPKMMKNQSNFFAVGAGHLGGSSGVITLLRNAGFSVEAVKE